jgi:hypothetical protein
MLSIQWPPDLESGRAALVDGADELRQVIRLALLDAQNGNPFNSDLDPGGEAVWAAMAPAASGEAAARVRSVFARLERERRARLEAVDVADAGATGDRTITVRYLDLETGRPDVLEVIGG